MSKKVYKDNPLVISGYVSDNEAYFSILWDNNFII